jgi:hypothetical protein
VVKHLYRAKEVLLTGASTPNLVLNLVKDHFTLEIGVRRQPDLLLGATIPLYPERGNVKPS